MLKFQNFRSHLVISVLFHVFVLAALIMSFEFNARNFVFENAEKNEILNAVMIDSKIEMPQQPKPLLPPKVEKIHKKIQPPQPVAQEPEKERIQPQIKKQPEPQVKKNTIAIPDKHKKQIQKELIEKQLLDDLKKEVVQQKKVKDKQVKEKQKQKELEKAFEKELQAQSAKALQQQRAEERRIASAQAAKMRGIVDKYKALITQAIAQHWLVPNGVDKSLTSQLLIRVAPGGTVLDVQIVKSSGDDALDRSARTAVFKASPLPVPTEHEEFEAFRQFILKVKPENILSRDG